MPGNRSNAAMTRTPASARASARLMPGSAWRRSDASARAGAADRTALRVAPADDRLDEPVVALATPVQDRHALVLGVHEHEERVAELLHPRHRVLLEHRLDRETLDLDDA